MSVQGGVWNFDGRLADHEFLTKMSQATARYGPDGGNSFRKGPVGMFHRAFHTTRESRLERQPYISARGNILTFDGRLDNRGELISKLQAELHLERTDVAIVMAAYEHWGTDCFCKLIGDWAVSLYNCDGQVLILAKDFMGPRHLYFRLTRHQVYWCTVLDPIVLLAGRSFDINSEYIAGYFDVFPAGHLTPYVGVDSVPPGTFVQIKSGRVTTHAHWSVDPSKRTKYRTDAEYEEHFRGVFKEAVARRLRSDSPVVSELSGGMDSSSIVCMADVIIAEGNAQTPRLDTISYYDDGEPNWDETPYFSKVEEKRGRRGCHIDTSAFQAFKPLQVDYFSALPGIDQSVLEFEQKRYSYIQGQGNRVLLSGIGGDEVMGGVPTPIPELADLLAQRRLRDLIRQIKEWSLVRKQPWSNLLWQALRAVAPLSVLGSFFHTDIGKFPPWLDLRFAQYCRRLSPRMNSNIHLRTFMPSQRSFLRVMTVLKNQLSCTPESPGGCYEERYPYLDRDLIEFMLSIPREQILRPRQRRSLMRRAFAQLVPQEILERKRKAYVVRRPLTALESEWPTLQVLFDRPLSARLGFIHPRLFSEALHAAIHGSNNNLVRLHRALKLELWLVSLSTRGVLGDALSVSENAYSPIKLTQTHTKELRRAT